MNIDWGIIGIAVGAVLPLLGAPVALVWHYLKTIHEYQVLRGSELTKRLSEVESTLMRLSVEVRSFERDYTTKDEWVRELTETRKQMEKLIDQVMGVQLQLKNGNGVAHQLADAAEAMLKLAGRETPEQGGGGA